MAEKATCRFSKTHEWAAAEGGNVTIGISDYAVEQLGDIVFVELPKPGKKVSKEKGFGVVESVKAAVEIYSPIDGEVVESNAALADNFNELLSKDPFGKGWMIKVKPADPAQVAAMMDAAAYDAYIHSPECKH